MIHDTPTTTSYAFFLPLVHTAEAVNVSARISPTFQRSISLLRPESVTTPPTPSSLFLDVSSPVCRRTRKAHFLLFYNKFYFLRAPQMYSPSRLTLRRRTAFFRPSLFGQDRWQLRWEQHTLASLVVDRWCINNAVEIFNKAALLPLTMEISIIDFFVAVFPLKRVQIKEIWNMKI